MNHQSKEDFLHSLKRWRQPCNSDDLRAAQARTEQIRSLYYPGLSNAATAGEQSEKVVDAATGLTSTGALHA
ncbi:MAG: hypothetical protein NDI90_20755 [Nitrospira sp. BO4]|nr:hypothetical protein [Nitrospira sp. BO4]